MSLLEGLKAASIFPDAQIISPVTWQ